MAGAALATAFVDVRAKTDKIKPDTESALKRVDGKPAGTKIGSDLTAGIRSKTSNAGKSIGKELFAGFAGAAAAAGVVSVIKGSIGAASDLNETVSKSNVIFGDNAKAVQAWANGSAKNIGLSKQAALDATASLGDMFSQLGLTGGQAVKFSEQTVQMAADLGSFNNLPTADVLDSVTAAFRGEYDSLQRVIPNINAARVQQEALSETHKKSVNDLTAAEKATATLNIVMKDGARASGDFARTSGGLANSQKIAAASFEDAKAKLGTSLTPALTSLTQVLSNDVIPAVSATIGFMQEHGTETKIVAGTVLGLVVAVKSIHAAQSVWNAGTTLNTAAQKVLGRQAVITGAQIAAEGAAAEVAGGKVKSASVLSAKGFGSVGTKIGSAASGFAGFAGPVGGAALALGLFNPVLDKSKNKIGDLASVLNDTQGALVDAARALVVDSVAATGAYDAGQKLGVSQSLITDAVLGNADAVSELNAQLKAAITPAAEARDSGKQLTASQREQVQAFHDVSGAVENQSKQVRDQVKEYQNKKAAMDGDKDSANNNALAQKNLTGATIITTGKLKDESAAALDLKGAFDKLNGTHISAEEATIRFKDDIDALTNKFTEAKKNNDAYSTSLDINTAAGRDNRQAVLDNIKAAQDHAVALFAQNKNATAVVGAFKADEDQIRAAAKAAGLNVIETDKMIKTYGGVPKEVATAATLETKAAAKKADDLKKKFTDLSDPVATTYTINGADTAINQLTAINNLFDPLVSGISSYVSSPAVKPRASGGPVTAGKPYIVGENRPELFVPTQNGRIEPSVPDSYGGPSTIVVQQVINNKVVQELSIALDEQKNRNGRRN